MSRPSKKRYLRKLQQKAKAENKLITHLVWIIPLVTILVVLLLLT